jgi:aminoglycoside 6'-N-acetyltransferase
VISYRHLQPADFPLLGGWLAQPHVARWWNHETSPEAVERDFGPTARGEEPNEDLLVHVDDTPVALVQRSWLRDNPDYRAELAAIAPVPDDALTIDYLIGDPTRTGRGLGSAIIRFVAERTWHEHPAAQAIVVAVHVDNRPSWRALEKAGFTRAGTGDMTPDNPIDSRAHHVYRLDRDCPGSALVHLDSGQPARGTISTAQPRAAETRSAPKPQPT